MSRVEDQKKAQAESARLQKQADRATRDAKKTDDSRQRFGELVKHGRVREQVTQQVSQRSIGEQVLQQQGRSEQDAARMARLARGGTLQHGRILEQVKSFEGTLQGQQTQSSEADQGRVERREEGMVETRSLREDRVSDLDKKREARVEADKEQAKAEAHAELKANAAIDGQARGKGNSHGEGDAPTDGSTVQAVGSPKAQAAEEAKAAREVQQLPEAILEALANEVYVGVNEKGLAEFRVELKEGVLQGASLRITADGGKIHLAFEGLSGNAKRLIQASEGDLARRLQAKGLWLERLSA